jgi:hypothetical protein
MNVSVPQVRLFFLYYLLAVEPSTQKGFGGRAEWADYAHRQTDNVL